MPGSMIYPLLFLQVFLSAPIWLQAQQPDQYQTKTLNSRSNNFIQQVSKARIIVTTDITNEPDDQESLVRLLTYANDFDIEGLIGSTGIWKLCEPATHVIHQCIDAYAMVLPNLLLHDTAYPSAEYLHSITSTGNRSYGMSSVGHRVSKGAQTIIDAVDKDDPRPVWCLIWGGANTVAQAIWTVTQSRSDEQVSAFIQKLRIYDLAAQDDAGAWMAKTFPELFMIRNVKAYKGMSQRFSSNRWNTMRGGDESVTTKQWVKENIQINHGPLGEQYPTALHIWEGDTPTYFYLMPNGLNDPEQQWQGSWGGRFSREKKKNVNIIAQEYAGHFCEKGGCFVNEIPFLDYWLYADATDKWAYQDTIYENVWCPIFRWRTDFQHDFAARMDRCILPYDDVNHNPVAIVQNDQSKRVIYEEITANLNYQLTAVGSYDPDGDELEYKWWIYKEAGDYEGELSISNPTSRDASLHIPQSSAGKNIHIVLTLKDNGKPALSSYRRIVLQCEE